MVRAAPALLLALAMHHASHSLRIGVQFGMPYIPFYVADQEKLFAKQLAARGLAGVAVSLQRFSGSSSINDAMLSGQVDMAVYAVTALLVVWEKTRNTSAPIVGVSGVTTMPASMVTVRPDLKSLKDIVASDRIATAARSLG
ncbi:MAG: ABC transporter substrate-binding protein [Pseudomonadota bacterium]